VSVAGADLGATATDPEPRRSSDAGFGASDTASGGKLAAKVARQIEAGIIAAGWPVGSVLGSELELRERYGVSRSILREAVRLTEHHQVTRMRRGPGGGLVVVAPDAGPALHAMVIYLEYIGLSVDDLMEARLLLEPLAAAAAAERVSEEDILELRTLLDEEVERRDETGLHAQDRLHVVLGRMSGNPALELFVDVLTRLTASHAYTAGRLPKNVITAGKVNAHEKHVEIVGAVIAGDGLRASAATTDHLSETAAWLREHRSPRRRVGGTRLPDPPGVKLAESVAAQILAEIVRRGWPRGLVLGSEADLLARYGISRSVLREAVRLLEYHSIAVMRRGPGGGLVVHEPEPEASIDAMALYLDYRSVGPEDLRVVREAIELGALGRVVARRGEAEIAERLQAAIDRTNEPTAPQRTGADHFHAELAALSGNPVLELFLRILTELWSRHRARPTSPTPGPDAEATVVRIHSRILTAILDGDEEIARHRMRRHLEAMTAWYE
jgi:DNA-binding FadR family transcriptional regulator